MSAWHKLAALGLLASLATMSCTVSSGDDDETAGTGGTSASGGSGGSGGSGDTGGTGGSTGGSGGSTGGMGGAGGSTGGTGGTGGTTIMCDPAAAGDNSCQACVEGDACCDLFETCANDEICGYNEAEQNEMRCLDGCRQAICLSRLGMEQGSCDATMLSEQITQEDEADCEAYCVPGGIPSAGEYMCTVGCMQGATVALDGVIPNTTPINCGSACMSPNSGLGSLTVPTTDLVDCVIENCDTCGISPAVE